MRATSSYDGKGIGIANVIYVKVLSHPPFSQQKTSPWWTGFSIFLLP